MKPSVFWPSDWVAVAASADVRRDPLKVMLHDRPVVLFRGAEGLSAFSDMCPHRFAPLSNGRVVEGQIECPYHGWRFDGTGQCRAVPGLIGEAPNYRVPTYAVRETSGLIFVMAKKTDDVSEREPYITALNEKDTISFQFRHQVRSNLADVADNILDTAHTHYVHKGILRGLSQKRSRVTATVTGGDGWVEARFEGEPHQDGILTRLLEGWRSVGIGRFIYPGIVELEYWGRDLSGRERMTMASTFHLRQDTREQVRGIGVLSGPRDWGFGYVKAALFKPLFRLGVAQDVAMLETCGANRAAMGGPKMVNGPLDLLRPSIDAILAGERPPVMDQPIVTEMAL